MPGFCERLQELSGLARKAFAEAISLSGQTRPAETQHYTSYLGASPMPSGIRVESVTSQTADRHTYTLPPLQMVSEQPARLLTPGPSAVGHRREAVQARHVQWQPDTLFVRRQESALGTGTASQQYHIGCPSTATTSSNYQVGSAAMAVTGRQTSDHLPTQPEYDDQSAAGIRTPTSFSASAPAALDQQADNGSNLLAQWQPEADFIRQQEMNGQADLFRSSQNASDSMQATLVLAGESFPQPGDANRAESQPQPCFGASENFDTTLDTHFQDTGASNVVAWQNYFPIPDAWSQ